MNLENKIEAQRKRMEQEKNKLDMLMKKAKMEQRKADNHRKIVVGANFETFLNEPRRYSEEQTRRIMQVAFATREVKNCMEQIERELARAEEKMPDTAINEEADEDENEEEYKWYNKNVQKIQNKNVQRLYCYHGGRQYDFEKQYYHRYKN